MSELLGASATRALGIIVYVPSQSHSALTMRARYFVSRTGLSSVSRSRRPRPSPEGGGAFLPTRGPPTSRLVVLRFGCRVAYAARSQGGAVERDGEHRQLGPSGPGAVRCLGSCLGQVLAMLRER